MRPTWRDLAREEARLFRRHGRHRPDLLRLYRLRALYGPVIEREAGIRLSWGAGFACPGDLGWLPPTSPA